MQLSAALFILFFQLGFLQALHSQDICPSPTNIITAHRAESCFMGEVYTASSGLRGSKISDRTGYRKVFDGYLYRIDLMIILDGENFVWNKPLEVHFIFSNGNNYRAVINEEMLTIRPHEFYTFSFDFKTYDKGPARIELNPLPGQNEENIRFYGTSVCLR